MRVVVLLAWAGRGQARGLRETAWGAVRASVALRRRDAEASRRRRGQQRQEEQGGEAWWSPPGEEAGAPSAGISLRIY